jgi:hypothetical protein
MPFYHEFLVCTMCQRTNRRFDVWVRIMTITQDSRAMLPLGKVLSIYWPGPQRMLMLIASIQTLRSVV